MTLHPAVDESIQTGPAAFGQWLKPHSEKSRKRDSRRNVFAPNHPA